MTKKGRQFFQEQIGVTPSVAAPADTNPSDATAVGIYTLNNRRFDDDFK